eukprot:352068-Chlamydomonas_euryale.AAC.14
MLALPPRDRAGSTAVPARHEEEHLGSRSATACGRKGRRLVRRPCGGGAGRPRGVEKATLDVEAAWWRGAVWWRGGGMVAGRQQNAVRGPPTLV